MGWYGCNSIHINKATSNKLKYQQKLAVRPMGADLETVWKLIIDSVSVIGNFSNVICSFPFNTCYSFPCHRQYFYRTWLWIKRRLSYNSRFLWQTFCRSSFYFLFFLLLFVFVLCLKYNVGCVSGLSILDFAFGVL